MESKLKDFIEQPRTTRKRRKGYILEVGQGVLFFLGNDEIYDGVYLTIDDGELFANDYEGELNTFEDLDAFYASQVSDGDTI